MRHLKVFVPSRCEGDREEARELRQYGRDLMVWKEKCLVRRAV